MALVGCTISQKLSQVTFESCCNHLWLVYHYIFKVARSTRGCIYTFLLTAAGDRFELIHRTETPYVSSAAVLLIREKFSYSN